MIKFSKPLVSLSISISILIKHIVGLFVCLFVCLFEIANLFRLKSERHETRHVGPLGMREGSYPNGFLN